MTYFGLRWTLDEDQYAEFIKKFAEYPNQSYSSFRVYVMKEYGLVMKYSCDEGMDSPYVAKIYLNIMPLNFCDLNPESFDKYFGRVYREAKEKDPKIQRAIDVMDEFIDYPFDAGSAFSIYSEG